MFIGLWVMREAMGLLLFLEYILPVVLLPFLRVLHRQAGSRLILFLRRLQLTLILAIQVLMDNIRNGMMLSLRWILVFDPERLSKMVGWNNGCLRPMRCFGARARLGQVL